MSPITHRGRPTQLPSLTSLRFFAALAVFLFHISLFDSPVPPNDPINPFADPGVANWLEWMFGKAGYLGVSFFFVLSGFVLTWSALPGDSVRSFWRRRACKIFPNHLVMFVLAMVLFAGATTRTGAWLPNVFLLHSFFPQPDVYVSVNPPAWTLCSELLFYLLFPFIFKLVSRVPGKQIHAWLAVIVLGTVLVQGINIALVPDVPASPIVPLGAYQFWFGYIFPVPRLLEFVLGMFLARSVMERRFPAIHPGLAILSVAIGYAISLQVPFALSFVSATIVPICLVIGAYAVRDNEGRRTGIEGPRAQWFGEISFGFYICQGVVIFYGRSLLPSEPFTTPTALLVTGGLLVASILAGWTLYALVERPVMRRWSRSRATTGIAPAPDRSRSPVSDGLGHP
jgi:peptidoglycan/LPS O-acetylase OafA/YrhL